MIEAPTNRCDARLIGSPVEQLRGMCGSELNIAGCAISKDVSHDDIPHHRRRNCLNEEIGHYSGGNNEVRMGSGGNDQGNKASGFKARRPRDEDRRPSRQTGQDSTPVHSRADGHNRTLRVAASRRQRDGGQYPSDSSPSSSDDSVSPRRDRDFRRKGGRKSSRSSSAGRKGVSYSNRSSEMGRHGRNRNENFRTHRHCSDRRQLSRDRLPTSFK